jgi:hypothetical protein
MESTRKLTGQHVDLVLEDVVLEVSREVHDVVVGQRPGYDDAHVKLLHLSDLPSRIAWYATIQYLFLTLAKYRTIFMRRNH